MIQHLKSEHPDRLDDYRREEIAFKRAHAALRYGARIAEPADWQPQPTELDRKAARVAAVQELESLVAYLHEQAEQRRKEALRRKAEAWTTW